LSPGVLDDNFRKACGRLLSEYADETVICRNMLGFRRRFALPGFVRRELAANSAMKRTARFSGALWFEVAILAL